MYIIFYKLKKSNLVNILRACSKKEVREFTKWLHSPVHNQREDVIKLLNFLMEDDHLLKDDFLEKAYVFQRIFPKEPYNDGKMRQVIYFMSKSLEEFLIYQELRSDEMAAKIALAGFFRKKKLDKSYKKTIKLIDNMIEAYPYRNRHFFRNMYALQNEHYAYQSQKSRSESLNLQETSSTLDEVYLADKLRQSCFMQAHQKVYKTNYDTGLLSEVLEYVEKGNFLDIPAIAIYYYDYKSKTEPEQESHFEHLKNEIFQHISLFPKAEQRDIYMLAINYCIGKINLGNEKYIREIFELFKQGFEQKALIQDNQISRWSFGNAFTSGLKLKEFDWLEHFIKEYEHFLPEEYREGTVHFSYAMLYNEKKEYDQAKEHLLKVDYKDILVNLNAKTILIKIYYIENEITSLESLLESMRIYIQRKKVMGYHKANFKNIIRFTKKLLRVVNGKQKEKLKLEIEETNPLSEREWLLEQLRKIR